MAESLTHLEEEPRIAFSFPEFLIERDYDSAMLNMLKVRLKNYYKYLHYKHVEDNKESAKALKLRKNTRYLFEESSQLKIGEKIYNLAKLEGIKQYWLDCLEWRKNEENQDYLLGYQDYGKMKFKVSTGDVDLESLARMLEEYKDYNMKLNYADDYYDPSEEKWEKEKVKSETEKLEWMLEKEK